jgi:MFS family permease
LSLAAAPPYRELAHAAPVAVVSCALSGLINGTFYALVPAWMQGAGVARETIALFMFWAVMGGLAFQVPVGRLSDRLDRRRVLAALGLGLAAVAVALVHLPRSLAVVLPAAALLGGFMSMLYPVCVAHAHDRMPADRVVAVSGALILVSGLGSMVGPLLGTRLMATFDVDGVLYLMAAGALLLALFAAGRSLVRASPAHADRPFDVLAPQAASLAHDPVSGDMLPTAGSQAADDHAA